MTGMSKVVLEQLDESRILATVTIDGEKRARAFLGFSFADIVTGQLMDDQLDEWSGDGDPDEVTAAGFQEPIAPAPAVVAAEKKVARTAARKRARGRR